MSAFFWRASPQGDDFNYDEEICAAAQIGDCLGLIVWRYDDKTFAPGLHLVDGKYRWARKMYASLNEAKQAAVSMAIADAAELLCYTARSGLEDPEGVTTIALDVIGDITGLLSLYSETPE